MTLDQIDWTQGCCGESYKWAEIQVPSGWLRIKDDPDGTYYVTRFDAAGKMVAEESVMTAAEVSALLA